MVLKDYERFFSMGKIKMDSKKQKRIGVVVGNLDSPHAYELAKGMSHAAEDKNINLLVFPGMHSQSSYDREMSLHKVEYDYQFNTIYDLAIKEDIDAIVVSMGTVADFLSSNEIESFLNKFSEIPTLILEEDIQNEFCMRYNNKSGLKECIKHLILEHGYRKIAFISGSLNNHDAIERLDVYRETMHEYDLPYEESMIVYGNFTEYLDNSVSKLLDTHGDLEAIVCANDMMAVGVYKELKRRGMVVGKDIAVTGFDDYVVAMSMDPPLTTVRVNPYSFGYRALLEAEKIADGEKISSYQVDSTLVVRSSCGCRAVSENQIDFAFNTGHNQDLIEYYSDYISMGILKNQDQVSSYEIVRKAVKQFVEMAVKMFIVDEHYYYNQEELVVSMRTLINEEHKEFINTDKWYVYIGRFIQTMAKRVENNQKKLDLLDLITALHLHTINRMQAVYGEKLRNTREESWYATFITRDTMIYSADEREALYQIVEKLRGLHFKSSYIFLFKEPIQNYNNYEWKCPDELYMAAFQNRNTFEAYEPNERPCMSLKEAIDKIENSDEKRIIMHFNLFANATQYGVIIFESTLKEASFAYMISLQVGSALKLLHMMREQMKMQKQLELSFETISRKNELLSQLSVSDEMTGLLNRRGLFEEIIEMMSEHIGSLAALIFVDMDNLKGINDTFGHSEGDFALKSLAQILKNSMRRKDVVGRIGGDEFAAFTIIDEPGLIHRIKKQIEQLSKELNNNCNKPYYVEMSVGIKEFICHPGMDLKDVLKEADAVLYENKRNKRKSFIKE